MCLLPMLTPPLKSKGKVPAPDNLKPQWFHFILFGYYLLGWESQARRTRVKYPETGSFSDVVPTMNIPEISWQVLLLWYFLPNKRFGKSIYVPRLLAVKVNEGTSIFFQPSAEQFNQMYQNRQLWFPFQSENNEPKGLWASATDETPPSLTGISFQRLLTIWNWLDLQPLKDNSPS